MRSLNIHATESNETPLVESNDANFKTYGALPRFEFRELLSRKWTARRVRNESCATVAA